mmetsp:Transcript_38433/g.96456  ORF Transcript_38433/g.96456 Transcript_38433/m.96456 type:complete len:676 (+) Transcript_38433:201-2228(+)
MCSLPPDCLENDEKSRSSSSSSSKLASPSSFASLLGLLGDGGLSGGGAEDATALERKTLEALPEAAERLAEESVEVYLLERQRLERQRHAELYRSGTSQVLLRDLLGGVSVRAATRGPSAAEQAKRRGQMAKPETLEFAQWLAYNASATAKERQHMCFDYSAESSSAMDAFATQIQGMVSQMQGFLDVMTKYATPSGIDRLEATIKDFAKEGMNDVSAIIEKRISTLLNTSTPKLESAIRNAAHKAGETLGKKLGQALATPVGQAIEPAVNAIIGDITNGSDSAKKLLGGELSKELGKAVANMTTQKISEEAGEVAEDLVDMALKKGSGAAGDILEKVTNRLAKPSLLDAGIDKLYHSVSTSRRLKDQVDRVDVLSALATSATVVGPTDVIKDAVSGAWNTMVNLLKALVNTLPTATSMLKYARREVSKLYSNLDSTFEVFEVKGPALFNKIAGYYRAIWLLYFLCLLPLNLLILYYAFWSGGYFGGPVPIAEDEHEAPKTFREKCALCCSSCSSFMRKGHDTTMCFWSVVLFMQIIVLVIFLASIALCILAGVKAFILAGCDQIYVLGDLTICSETLGNLKGFMDSFFVSDATAPLTATCDEDHLLTCGLIKKKMSTSTILTTVFSLLATLFSLQLIIDSAVLHEQARWRRLAHALFRKEAAGSAGSEAERANA